MSLFSNIKTELSLVPGTVKHALGMGDKESTIKETVESGAKKIGGFVPGDEVAKGLGIAIGTLERDVEEQEKLNRRQQRLQNELMVRMDQAKKQGDQNRYNRLKNIAQDTANDEIEIISENILKDAPSNKQVIASGVELGLTAAIGFKPRVGGTGRLIGGRATKVANDLNRIKNIEATKRMLGVGEKGAKVINQLGGITRESLIGAGFFASVKAQEEDASVEDIVRAGEMGGLVGGGTIAGAGLIGKTAEKVFPKVGKAAKRGVRKLEEISAGEGKPSKGSVDKMLTTIGEKRTPLQFGADSLLRGVQAARQFKNKLIDRFAPLKRIEDDLIELKGGPLKENEKVYRDLRLLTSVADNQAEDWVTKLGNDLRPYNDINNELKAYLLNLDYLDRVKLGTGKVPGGLSERTLKKNLRNLINEVGPENAKRLGEARNIVRKYHRTRLQDRVDAGLIDQKQMDEMLKAHPNYIPHNVIMDIDEKAVRVVSDSYNVSKTDLMKAVGSLREIEDPLSAIGQRSVISSRTAEKNKVLNNLIKAQEKYSVMPGAKKITSGAKPKKNFDKIHLFRDGKQEVWQVPKDVATAIKNIDAPTNSGLFRLATFPANVLRRFATRYNLSFTIPNKFRDKQTALLTADAFTEDLAKRYGLSREGFKPVNKSHLSKKVKRMYRESGGFGASVFEEGEDQILKKMQKAGVNNYTENIKPHKLLEKVNDAFEQETRLEVFKKALNQGLSPKDAALVSRDATIDFAKMGSWMRKLNQAVPFLNARVQGFVNLPRAMKKAPETFARMQLYTAAYPTMALHAHNRKFDSYNNISQYYKNKYWIIMTGETKTNDSYSGEEINVPHFITVPKAEGQTLVSNPIQWWLEKQDGRDYRKTSEMLVDTLGSASPLEFQSFNQTNWWSTMVSQLGPAATIPYGLASNLHPYFGRKIVPEKRKEAKPELQFRETTPEIVKELGDIMGVAPAKVEFALNSFGGLTRDLQSAADMIFGLIKNEDLKKNLRDESISKTGFGVGSRFPVARRFMREAREFYNPESEFRRRQKEKIETQLKSQKLRTYDQADDIWGKMNRLDTKQEKVEYLNSLGDELTPEIKKRLLYLRNNRDTNNVLSKNDSVELRARYIQQKIDQMKHSGVSKDQRIQYLQNLRDSGILTKKTIKMIRAIQMQD